MSGTAQALTRSQSFNVSWTFKSKKLGVCVTFSVSGKISYTAVQGPHSMLWKDQKLKSPTLTAKVHAYNKGRCTGSAKLRKISMGQFWTGYSCSFNPSLSASAPCGVSIGGWPSCGNRKRAGFTSNPDGPSAVFHQYNTGARVSFANHTGATKANDPAMACSSAPPPTVAPIPSRSASTAAPSPGRSACRPSDAASPALRARSPLGPQVHLSPPDAGRTPRWPAARSR